jgi:hypothetical protein
MDLGTGTVGGNYTPSTSCILCDNSETSSDLNSDWWIRCKKGKSITDVSEGCSEHEPLKPIPW